MLVMIIAYDGLGKWIWMGGKYTVICLPYYSKNSDLTSEPKGS